MFSGFTFACSENVLLHVSHVYFLACLLIWFSSATCEQNVLLQPSFGHIWRIFSVRLFRRWGFLIGSIDSGFWLLDFWLAVWFFFGSDRIFTRSKIEIAPSPSHLTISPIFPISNHLKYKSWDGFWRFSSVYYCFCVGGPHYSFLIGQEEFKAPSHGGDMWRNYRDSDDGNLASSRIAVCWPIIFVEFQIDEADWLKHKYINLKKNVKMAKFLTAEKQKKSRKKYF